MERRVLLAVVLSFIVLYGYQAIFPPPAPVERRTDAPAVHDPARPSPAPAAPAGSAAPAAASQPVGAEAPKPLLADAVEREVTFENAEVQAVFSTRGATLTHWR